MTCPVCGKPCVRRGGHALRTCGDKGCSYELRATRTRGNTYGDRGGGPGRSETVGYNAAHSRARRTLRNDPCALDDGTCKGRLEVALRHDAPADLVRMCIEHNARYFVGVVSEDGYRRLCRSHHAREGALMAVVSRLSDPTLALAVLADQGYAPLTPTSPKDTP